MLRQGRHPNEFILYPNPREITSLPAHRVQPFIFERLSAEAKGAPGLEYTMASGKWRGRSRCPTWKPLVLRWLDGVLPAGRYDAGALFLWGYWPGREPSTPLAGKLLDALDTLSTCGKLATASSRRTLLAFNNSTNAGLKLRVREKFALLRAHRDEFQPSVQNDIDRVLAEDLKRIQKKPLP